MKFCTNPRPQARRRKPASSVPALQDFGAQVQDRHPIVAASQQLAANNFAPHRSQTDHRLRPPTAIGHVHVPLVPQVVAERLLHRVRLSAAAHRCRPAQNAPFACPGPAARPPVGCRGVPWPFGRWFCVALSPRETLRCSPDHSNHSLAPPSTAKFARTDRPFSAAQRVALDCMAPNLSIVSRYRLRNSRVLRKSLKNLPTPEPAWSKPSR
jgi:hypothetical protein